MRRPWCLSWSFLVYSIAVSAFVVILVDFDKYWKSETSRLVAFLVLKKYFTSFTSWVWRSFDDITVYQRIFRLSLLLFQYTICGMLITISIYWFWLQGTIIGENSQVEVSFHFRPNIICSLCHKVPHCHWYNIGHIFHTNNCFQNFHIKGDCPSSAMEFVPMIWGYWGQQMPRYVSIMIIIMVFVINTITNEYHHGWYMGYWGKQMSGWVLAMIMIMDLASISLIPTIMIMIII